MDTWGHSTLPEVRNLAINVQHARAFGCGAEVDSESDLIRWLSVICLRTFFLRSAVTAQRLLRRFARGREGASCGGTQTGRSGRATQVRKRAGGRVLRGFAHGQSCRPLRRQYFLSEIYAFLADLV